MIWESKEGMWIEVSEAALASVAKHISSRKRGETGGILIGRYSDDLSTAKVMSASGPGPRSTFGPSSFTRQVFSLQAELDREFETGGYYLGEWHCHPGTNSAPSSQDIRQMKAISKSAGYNCPEPILMVFGKKDPNAFVTAIAIRNERIINFKRKGIPEWEYKKQ